MNKVNALLPQQVAYFGILFLKIDFNLQTQTRFYYHFVSVCFANRNNQAKSTYAFTATTCHMHQCKMLCCCFVDLFFIEYVLVEFIEFRRPDPLMYTSQKIMAVFVFSVCMSTLFATAIAFGRINELSLGMPKILFSNFPPYSNSFLNSFSSSRSFFES